MTWLTNALARHGLYLVGSLIMVLAVLAVNTGLGHNIVALTASLAGSAFFLLSPRGNERTLEGNAVPLAAVAAPFFVATARALETTASWHSITILFVGPAIALAWLLVRLRFSSKPTA